jgi:hypothetical protein
VNKSYLIKVLKKCLFDESLLAETGTVAVQKADRFLQYLHKSKETTPRTNHRPWQPGGWYGENKFEIIDKMFKIVYT